MSIAKHRGVGIELTHEKAASDQAVNSKGGFMPRIHQPTSTSQTRNDDARYHNRVALLSANTPEAVAYQNVTETQTKCLPIATSICAQWTIQTFSLARMDSATSRDISIHFNMSGEVMGSSICTSSQRDLEQGWHL